MTPKEFDKAPLLDQILYDYAGMLVKNNRGIAEAMEKYHKAKLKEVLLAYEKSQHETTWGMSEAEATNRINDFLAKLTHDGTTNSAKISQKT
jgi:predicted Ser/Thr protein kinase